MEPERKNPPQKQSRPAAPASRKDAHCSPREFVHDDDAVIVPAPEPSVFVSPLNLEHRRSRHSSLFFRRTMIPILLTCGAMLAFLAVLWFRLEEDAPLRTGGIWLPITLFAFGLLLLALAMLNMLQVRHLLRQPDRPSR